MNLIIEASLSEPPSEVHCFRDITLYGKTFIFEDILVLCPVGTRTIYRDWLRNRGAFDFVSDLILPQDKESGYLIHPNHGNLVVDRITADNLNTIISKINEGYKSS